jgi:type III pantothenate kinase
MTPQIVVDVGNTRVKWGRCEAGTVTDFVGLPHDNPAVWQSQLERWGVAGPLAWVVSGVHPRTRDRLVDWIRRRADTVMVLESASQLSLQTRLEHPDKAGIDRLLNAVAVNTQRRPGVAAVIVDAGSAVTVDYLDSMGVYWGGAIFPGCRLMARALHQETALLPLVEIQKPMPDVPASATLPAMEAGIYWAVVGGIQALIERYKAQAGTVSIFVGGGDAELLKPALPVDAVVWPLMTLEGLRLTAERL